ncbi:hypothetical protein B0H19DRAFT_1274798 [Mycena capillaripes]|nr:hypothetical protein B0H19DRAFT_1274798 [Mycena capillaripes]
MHFPFSLTVFLYILGVLCIVMLTPLPTASSSPLAQCRTSGVLQARNNAIRSPYQSPRDQRANALRSPLRSVLNIPRPQVRDTTAGPTIEQERSDVREAERKRQAALQETPSRRRRRVPGQTENHAPSPTLGASQAQQMRPLGLATPPDSQPPRFALKPNKVEATFDLDAHQYSQFANNYGNFLLSCTIMTSGHWPTNEKKPTPYHDKYVQDTKRFKMNVNNVTFLGNPPKSNAPKAPVPSTPVPSSSQARTIDHFAGTSSWMKKRKLNDGSDGPSSPQ